MADSTLHRASGVSVREDHDGRIVRVTLRAPPENALDVTVLADLARTLESLADRPSLGGVVLEGEGPDFSTGLALAQRRAPYMELLLAHLHACARRLVALDTLVVARVRGRCFGAAADLSLLAHATLADATARFAFPDVALGSFSPLSTLLLPDRLGRARAEDLQLTGRTLPADEATQVGLVTECASGWDDLDAITNRWLERHVLSRSNLALRAFARASRAHLHDLLGARLDELEKLYLDTVLPSRDAEEGITATLHRRPPRWSHR